MFITLVWYLSRLQHDYSVPTGTSSLTHPLPVFITGLHTASFHYRGAAAKMCHTFLKRREQKNAKSSAAFTSKPVTHKIIKTALIRL